MEFLAESMTTCPQRQLLSSYFFWIILTAHLGKLIPNKYRGFQLKKVLGIGTLYPFLYDRPQSSKLLNESVINHHLQDRISFSDESTHTWKSFPLCLAAYPENVNIYTVKNRKSITTG